MKSKWIRKKPGLYFYFSKDANAEIFSAPTPFQRWAWAVYTYAGSSMDIEMGLREAKIKANAAIVKAERAEEQL